MKRSVTFIVTDECNSRCHYCYMVNKTSAVMSLETARAAVDCILADPRAQLAGASLDFIGGEPLLQPGLIDEIIRYARLRMFELGHPWLAEHTWSISTNGLNYLDPAVQRLTRYRGLEMQITLDGPEDVHDSQRGAGAYAQVMRAFPLWRRQYPQTGTKVTLAPATLPHLARSVLHLLGDLELPTVHANPVFEDVWADGDARVYEAQLEELAAGMAARGIGLDRCSLFDSWVGGKAVCETNWCGCGRYMLAVGTDGTFYPCVRFAPSTLHRQPLRCGSVATGIDWAALQVFEELTAAAKSPPECLECPVSAGCAWCTGHDYDEAGTVFHRSTHICGLHKARARVCRRIRYAA